ncbi:hypothetical protein POM88_032921 [Heracleum sosnowskyi]|uniref:Uncharacterized protein n=1 Tax=Heracleum sosnowskyi TaxID=360622 RepID=A0AAD8MLR4_9APIA|nr:hypothetical protein POM88_032921 [Heracleum sosnowskyi]
MIDREADGSDRLEGFILCHSIAGGTGSVFQACFFDTWHMGILTTLSQTNGTYKYDYATVPFLAEVFNLLVSVILLRREFLKLPPPLMTKEWKTIMGNLKVVTTAVLFRLFLRRKLCNMRWMEIFL